MTQKWAFSPLIVSRFLATFTMEERGGKTMLRILKSALVLIIGLHALFYALQNIANLSAAHAALGYVLSNTEHASYPNTLFFAVTDPILSWLALALVLIGEFAVGFFGIKGGWDLFKAKGKSAEEFHAAKKAGVIAAGLALLIWFGFFMTFGAAFFQMWQTEVGAGSMEGAFMYSVASVITMLFVCLTDD
jgi:predicted small integral membrane protein